MFPALNWKALKRLYLSITIVVRRDGLQWSARAITRLLAGCCHSSVSAVSSSRSLSSPATDSRLWVSSRQSCTVARSLGTVYIHISAHPPIPLGECLKFSSETTANKDYVRNVDEMEFIWNSRSIRMLHLAWQESVELNRFYLEVMVLKKTTIFLHSRDALPAKYLHQLPRLLSEDLQIRFGILSSLHADLTFEQSSLARPGIWASQKPLQFEFDAQIKMEWVLQLHISQYLCSPLPAPVRRSMKASCAFLRDYYYFTSDPKHKRRTCNDNDTTDA